MGHKYTKAEILAGAVGVAFEDGISQMTFGRVAKQIGVSDRVVVYYFPTKDDLIAETLYGIGVQLQETLLPAFASPADDHVELVRLAWPFLASAGADPVFALCFEAAGLAASGREPYRMLVPQLVDAWITWASTFIRGSQTKRRAEAEAAIAVLDGLLLLRQLAGPAAADRAARKLGVR